MAGVKHAFVSGVTDDLVAGEIGPNDWNDPHLGNNYPGLIVAATNSSQKDKDGADYLCDGVADDVQLQAALDALETAGGGTLTLAEGDYTLAAGLLMNTNVRVRIIGYGAKLLLPASVSGIKINQGNSAAVGARIEGLLIDGQSNASTVGVEFEDTNNGELVAVQITACTTGILLDSQAASAFVEGTLIDTVVVRNCTTGFATTITSGSGSFAQTVMRNAKFTGCTTGISIVNLSIWQRSYIQATVWVANGQTAANVDGNIEDSEFNLGIEGAAGSTTATGFVMGTNATNTEQAFIRLLFTGTVNTQVTANSKNFHYWSGGSQIIGSAGTAVLGYRRHGDTTDRLRFEGVTAGGRIQLGDGSTLDVNAYRSAANILASDDKLDPASLNTQIKAGVPVDGDVVGGAADGDIIVDTTNNRLYFRAGGVWRPVSNAVISRGATNFNSGGLTTAVNVIVWRAPFACTVTNVRGYRVGGTGATINARRNGTSNHLASDLSLTSADTWMDGGAVQNTAYAAGDKLEIMFVSYTGSPTQVAIQVDFTRP